MPEPRYVVRDTAALPVAGDDIFDDQLKFVAAEVAGIVVDNLTGETVYDATPGSGLDSAIF